MIKKKFSYLTMKYMVPCIDVLQLVNLSGQQNPSEILPWESSSNQRMCRIHKHLSRSQDTTNIQTIFFS